MELRAFKFRLYPNREQEQKLAQFFGAKRWVFNHFLHENIQKRNREEKHLSNFDINKEITQLKKLARMTRGSKSFEKQRIKVAKCYEKITNIKNWYYHNLSTFLVRNYDSIFMEDLNVSGMLKNRKLSRKIHETGWSILVNMIKYKSESSGRLFHQINRFSPSSKTCSSCGHKLETLSLGTRDWICPSCSAHHDRDLNAAVNIKNFGQLDCYEKVLNSVETTELGIIPESLQKFTIKIERSFMSLNVCEGSRKATRSLVV